MGTTHKIGYGKPGGWISSLGVLFSLLAVAITITAQPGFLSISCGGTTNHMENNMTWVPDADYITVGGTADIGNFSIYGSYLHTLRFFPKPLNKSCYTLPLTPDVPYLLRLWFTAGNYTGLQNLSSFAFSIETVNMLHLGNVTIQFGYTQYYERILVTSGNVMYICLIRNSDNDDPSITAIELRKLQNGMYPQAKPGTILFPSFYNVGGNSVVRYPQDKFDRIWRSDLINLDGQSLGSVRNVSSPDTISTNNTNDLPPSTVMQTAWVGTNGNNLAVSFSTVANKAIMMFYFAEIETLNMSESRSFYVISSETRSQNITLQKNFSAIEITLVPNQFDSFEIVKAPNSTRPPILNAFEYHLPYATDKATFSQDINALDAIKSSFNIKDWISDPCYVINWDGIGCDNSSSDIRISKIDLSGKNLTGSVPNDIGRLTALVNLSLDNNHFIGSLPNLSNLTKLERLYLQNNNLSGNVEWLSELKNLQELNIENNNFTGVIPAHLLLNCSLKLNYSRNPYLLTTKRECTLLNSSSNKSKAILGITISGVLIIAVALITVIVVYRIKFSRRKRDKALATESTGVERELTSFLYQDYSIITVPNPTKSRAFTLNEMLAATQTFNREIGKGGFGSVFFGKLPDGKNIAVKVLSLFSHQGVEEFLNEVDLLSRINHRNLVSLLGYCNETREVMLIYDHMSGGSLRDHLYGTNAEYSELNWRSRLKIVLDAAQGLEYLHVGSTSKIIHRDIKTANILLDQNMNGKLADFGLSRMTIDGEATHITTAVKGTAGYLDPEYYSTQMLTEKSDVYSFGVVLLEIICGRPPIDLKLVEEELNMVRWVTPYLMEMDENGGKITEIIDKRFGGRYDIKSISGVAKVAMRCVQALPSCRPNVSEIVAELKEAIKHEDIASLSVSEEIGRYIESDDRLAASLYSSLEYTEPKAMEWGDNNSNLSKVGR